MPHAKATKEEGVAPLPLTSGPCCHCEVGDNTHTYIHTHDTGSGSPARACGAAV